MRIECPNYHMKEKTKNSKGKVLVATLSDFESDLFDDEIPKKLTLQEAYDKLYTEFIKSKKTYDLCRKELNEVKTEKLIC